MIFIFIFILFLYFFFVYLFTSVKLFALAFMFIKKQVGLLNKKGRNILNLAHQNEKLWWPNEVK